MLYKVILVNAVDFIGTDFQQASEHLSTLVNAEIEQGWKPIGGIAIGGTRSTKEPYLFQSMVKE